MDPNTALLDALEAGEIAGIEFPTAHTCEITRFARSRDPGWRSAGVL
jgi:hypothetical protein